MRAAVLPRSSATTLAAYRKKGLAGRVGYGAHPALLVVDLIVGFTDPRSPLATNLDAAVAATGRLLAAARKARLTVLFTTTAYDAECREAGLFVRKVPSLRRLRRGSRWVAIDPRLRPRRGELVIEKRYASAFFGTPLASTLHAAGVDTLIVAGCTTSGCVRASVVDGLQHGLRVIVPRECVGDRAAGPHEANLLDIDGKYGDVTSLAEVLAYLARGRQGGLLPRTHAGRRRSRPR